MLSCVLYPYVYLLVAHRLPRARRGPARRRPRARPDAVAQLPARLAADGAAGDRRRRGAGADGDAGRLRHRVVLRRADLHHRDLSRLVLARRPHRRGAAVDGLARLRRSSSSSLERLSRGRRALRGGAARRARAAPASACAAGAPRSRSPPARCRSRSASSCPSLRPAAPGARRGRRRSSAPRFLHLARQQLPARVADGAGRLRPRARARLRAPDRSAAGDARSATGLAGMGYAIPGSVIAVGVLIPLARLDNALADGLRSELRLADRAAPHRRHRRARLRLRRPLHGAGAADGRLGAGPDHAAHGRRRAQPRPVAAGDAGCASTCRCCGAAC